MIRHRIKLTKDNENPNWNISLKRHESLEKKDLTEELANKETKNKKYLEDNLIQLSGGKTVRIPELDNEEDSINKSSNIDAEYSNSISSNESKSKSKSKKDIQNYSTNIKTNDTKLNCSTISKNEKTSHEKYSLLEASKFGLNRKSSPVHKFLPIFLKDDENYKIKLMRYLREKNNFPAFKTNSCKCVDYENEGMQNNKKDDFNFFDFG